MPRAPKPPPPTFHHLAVAESLAVQSQAVANLISAVSAALSIMGDAVPGPVRERLEAQCNNVQAVFWPPETE